jgi:hypothetical protein
MRRSALTVIVLLTVLIGVLSDAAAQDNPTPVIFQLSSPTPLPIIGSSSISTPTPTLTPTDLGPVQLEVATTDPVNVRADPDPEGSLLGVIVQGERYTVTGRYFRWIQFRFPNSPNGLGWVFEDLVTLTGDTTLIPDLSVAPPTADPVIAAITLTAEAVALIPGGDLTVTASARELVGPVGVDPNATPDESRINAEGQVRQATFTSVPNVSGILARLSTAPTATPELNLLDLVTTPSGIPPIAPILLLGGLGMLGLAVSFTRR